MTKILTETQRQIIETNEKHVIVASAAASGKSTVIVERLKYLLNIGVPATEIVAITFTNNAASIMYERLGRPDGLFIGTVHSYCNYLLRGGAIDTTEIIVQERFDDLFKEIKKNPQCIRHVSHLLVDEVQDSTWAQFGFFELINPDNYMYCGDIRQSIYGWNGAAPEYIVRLSKQPDVVTYYMRQNFRNYFDILHFAKRFLYRLGPDYEDDSISMRPFDNFVESHTLECSYSAANIPRLISNYKNKLDTTWGDWFLLCRTNAEIEQFKFLLENEGIPTDTFKQAELTNAQIQEKMREDTVKILTVHSAKGLENKCVLVFNVRAYNDEEAKLCYVAATRARDFLIWVKVPSRKKRKEKIKTTNWE